MLTGNIITSQGLTLESMVLKDYNGTKLDVQFNPTRGTLTIEPQEVGSIELTEAGINTLGSILSNFKKLNSCYRY